MMTTLVNSDLASLAGYVPRVVGGESSAWPELVAQLEPLLIKLLRRSRALGPLRHNLDDCRAVMSNVLERLQKDNYRGLRLFQPWADANPGKSFGDWIRIVTINIARDHVSSRLDAERAAHMHFARARLEHAARSLEPAQFLALRRWLDGASSDELATELELETPRDADKLVRAALASLRMHLGARAHE